MKKAITLTLATAAVFCAGSAFAEEKEFGNPGVINFGAETGLNLAYTSTSPPTGSSTNVLDFSISPNVAYFVTEGLTVAGPFLLDYQNPKNVDPTPPTAIGPNAGYNFWL